MSYRFGETLAAPPDTTRKPPRQHVDAEVRRRASTVCKALLPGASPGEIASNCRNTPVTDDGWCAEHRP